METGVLILLSCVLVLLVWWYLNYDKKTAQTEQAENAVEGGNKGLIIYCAFCLLALCGIAIVLKVLYPMNNLITNIKLTVLLAILSTVTVTDIRRQIIPNKVILAGIALRTIIAVVELVVLGSEYFTILKSDLLSVGLTVVLFILGVLVMKNGIGMGDIKLIFVMGIYQGFTGIIASLFCSLCVAFCIAIVLLILKKKSRKDAMEFAPSVLIGTIISIVLTGM